MTWLKTLRVSAPLLLACALACAAQDSPKPASDNASEELAVDPARPTVSNPAHIPPAGHLQFEQGFLQANGTPGGPDSQFSLVQVTKLSLNSRLMLAFASEPFARSSQGGVASNDPGDLDLGAQVVLLDEEGKHTYMPTLALGYNNFVRAGTAANLDVGGFKRSLVMLASGSVHGFEYDNNYLFNEQQDDSPNLAGHIAPRRVQVGETLSVSHDLPAKFSLTSEIWSFSLPLSGGYATGSLWSLGYQPRKTLVFDAGFSRGLTSNSTHWETFAGFSYLLPHRLWPAHHHAG